MKTLKETIGASLAIIFLLAIINGSSQQEEDIPHGDVKNWALKFGVDLWEFGRQITKISEIKKKFQEDERATVARKDGLMLVREMAAEVKNMLDFKMNAVMKLMENAEQAAVSASRDSSSSLKYYSSHRINIYNEDKKLTSGSRPLELKLNRHFDHVQVNLSLSTILLPPGVKDSEAEVASCIQWSENLDPIFVNNYESDPSLSWQYFGSTSGFLRRYPGSAWPTIDKARIQSGEYRSRSVDDFRLSQWFVGGATSPKDLVILVDGSSLSSSKTRSLMMSTTNAILDSLGPDDFVNVYRYAESAEEIVACFKDALLSATPENIKELKSAMTNVKSENQVNMSAAFVTAFEILHKYNRSSLGSQCNQAIMMITTNTEGPPVDLVKKYNSPHMPVRIFTYLVGGESSTELQSLACENKGYYARITNADEVKSKVFEYIKVLARPMVQYQRDHPIHWTPLYIGGRSSKYNLEEQGQLMISVTAPILDRRNHSVKTANLLGIVGVDVPIDQLQKLVPPHKLGINGYSFIVDNNGRVLFHPDLRPLPGNTEYEETMKRNYIGVDLSEVELAENDGSMYSLNNTLLDMRHELVDQKEGETEFSVKVHYDDMKRVQLRKNRYFYKPIEDTPYSLALALPEGYGMFELDLELEIRHIKENVTNFFKGDKWKVHPDWTYCEYYFESDKWFDTPEERVLHFLVQAHKPGWKWRSLRQKSPSSHQKQAIKPDKDSYYCDKRLLQSLVWDAWATSGFEKKSEAPMHNENKGEGRFGEVRSFIATRSGLLRWHDHQKIDDIIDEPDFAETYSRAMDSTWYKRAVDQHAIEPDSFVFSVPFDAADSIKPLVTATHAIFVEKKGHKTPAAVVGIQFQHSSLASHFNNVTFGCYYGKKECKKTCASEELDCYILDNNGFVIISERFEHTGKFFGDIDGTIMDSLVQDKIFKKLSVIDYQGVCTPQTSEVSSATKSSIFKAFALMGELIWSWSVQFSLADILSPVWAHRNNYDNDDNLIYPESMYIPNDEDLDIESEKDNLPPIPKVIVQPAEPTTTQTNYPTYKQLRTCEKKADLYVLQPERLNTSGVGNPLKGKLTNCHTTGCERPFSVQKITHTNLILLVADTLCDCHSKKFGIEAIEALTEPGACTARRERLHRRRPSKCINYHPEELEIKVCAGAISSTKIDIAFLLMLIAVARLT